MKQPLVAILAERTRQCCRWGMRSRITHERVSLNKFQYQESKVIQLFHYRVPLVAACLPIAFTISGCNQPANVPPATPALAATLAQTPVERGKMLVNTGLCHDCHTPKKFGPKG